MEEGWDVIIIIGTALLVLLLILTLRLLIRGKDLAKSRSIANGSVEKDPNCQISVHLHPTSPDFYFTGQTVSCVVVLNSYGQNIEYEELFVEVNGCASVVLYNTASETEQKKRKSFLFLKIPLVKENSNYDEVTEKHYFPFSFVIPPESPASFEGRKGHVRYSMKAVLKRQDFTRLVFSSEVLLKCQRTVDLTRDALPGYQRRHENQRKSIKVIAWLDKSAYIPGEKIQFNAKIENGSGKSVKFTTVKLVQYTTFTDGRVNYPYTTKTLWKQRAGKISSNKEQIWDNVLIPVASVPPTGYPFCDLIKTSYAIEVYLGILCKKYLEISVMIGTTHIPEINQGTEVPHPSLISESPNSGSIENDNLAGVNSSSADLPPPYFSCVPHRHLDIPPPTYDSVFESTDL